MGLFSFLKKAGEKIFSQESTSGGNQANTTSTDNQPISSESAFEKERRLEQFVHNLGIEIEQLDIKVIDDHKVIVTGEVEAQADREKIILALGNVAGIDTVDDHIIVEEADEEAKFYEVQKGDSLSKIAKAFYGDPMKYKIIFEANRPMLKNPDLIYPGQMLRIPVL